MKNSKCAPAAYAAVNDLGKRIGEGHPRAILTDRDVELLLELRDEGWGWKRLASKFECSRRLVRDICAGRRRSQTPARWVRLTAPATVQSRP